MSNRLTNALNTRQDHMLRLRLRAPGQEDLHTDGRKIYEALAYAYEEPDTYGTTFARGTFADTTVDDFRILQYHRADLDPVGKPVEVIDTPEGLVVRFVLANTDRGREIGVLLDDGVLRAVSVGFIPLDGFLRDLLPGEEDYAGDGQLLVFTKAELHELSLVNSPASKGALMRMADGDAEAEKELMRVFLAELSDAEVVDLTLEIPEEVITTVKVATDLVSAGAHAATRAGREISQLLLGEAPLTEETVRRIDRYLSRTKVGPVVGTPATSEEVQFSLWGGEAGRAWARALVTQLDAREAASADELEAVDQIAEAVAVLRAQGVAEDVLALITRQSTETAAPEGESHTLITVHRTYANLGLVRYRAA